MINFETWWNSSSADEFRRLNDDMDGRVVRPVWDAAIRATLSSQKATSAAPSPEATQPEDELRALEREHLGDFDGRTGVYATQPTQAEVVLIHGVPVHGLLPEDREPMEAIVDAAYAYAKKLRTQPTQAEAPSEREIRRMLCVAYAGASAYMDDGEAQDNRTQPFIDFLRDSPEAIRQKMQARAALATQQAVQAEPVAFEFYNPTTDHAIVDYSRQTHVGPLTKEMGYEARPLGYINPPPAAMKPGDPVPLWQALEALDSLEESSRGDAPYNHFAAGLVRSALEQAATPPAPGQVERDREDERGVANVASFDEFTEASDHCLLASEQDLRRQAKALHEFALPALRWAEAQMNKQRDDVSLLDWLDAKNKPFKMGWHVGAAPAGNVVVKSVIYPTTEPVSIRAAIRAARSSEGEQA